MITEIKEEDILDVVSEHEEKLRHYISLLSKANEIARLTGPSDEEILWNDHLVDCAYALPMIPSKGRLIDVGTGGGLPGMVWAICRPDLEVTLLDSISRKCKLVEKMAIALGLKNVNVVCSRSEDYSKDNREKFDIASARAVCSAGILAEYLSPFIRVGGHAVAMKGPKVKEELSLIKDNKWRTLGFSVPALTSYTLNDMERYLLVWTKKLPAQKGFPRRPGMAEKYPWYAR